MNTTSHDCGKEGVFIFPGDIWRIWLQLLLETELYVLHGCFVRLPQFAAQYFYGHWVAEHDSYHLELCFPGF